MRGRRWRQVSCLLSLAVASATVWVFLAPSAGASASAPPLYRLVVNLDNPVTTLDRRFVEEAFLKKTRTWSDGQAIRPIDLKANSVLRERFSLEVLRRPVVAVLAYWQQNIFSGRDVPPPAVETDADVIHHVGRFRGGLGYVSAAAALAGAKVVNLR
jgi:hypothetical protein